MDKFSTSPHHEYFHQVVKEYGIQETHGVEILALIKAIANAFESIMAERMRDEKLSAPRWRLLVRLFVEEQRGNLAISPSQLSVTQNLSRNTISAHLRSLEEQGLIERQLDPDDLRQFHICLTRAGRELIRSSTPGHIRFLNDLIGALDPAEKEELQALLYKLYDSITQDRTTCGSCRQA